MALTFDKIILRHPPKKKPTSFRFKGNIRLGFRSGEVVEIAKFKKKTLGG